jgi:hypothetical protein
LRVIYPQKGLSIFLKAALLIYTIMENGLVVPLRVHGPEDEEEHYDEDDEDYDEDDEDDEDYEEDYKGWA